MHIIWDKNVLLSCTEELRVPIRVQETLASVQLLQPSDGLKGVIEIVAIYNSLQFKYAIAEYLKKIYFKIMYEE